MPTDDLGDGSILRFPADEFRDFHKRCIAEGRVQYDRRTGELTFEVDGEVYEADQLAARNNQQGGADEVFLHRRAKA